MNKPRRYTKEEHRFMQEFVPGHSYQEIREEFLKRFGGEVPDSFPGSFIKNNGLSTGRTGRFEKGSVPPNKGKPMSAELYAKAAPTMFKKGNRPYNEDPIGTEKKLADGYIWIKVDNQPKVKKIVNWIQKHRKIYQEQVGEIPEGYVVTFLDGDRENFDPENLIAIPKSVNARLNQSGLRSKNKELAKAGVKIAELKTKLGELRRAD